METTLAPWRRPIFLASALALTGSLYFFSPVLLALLGWFQEPFSELGQAEVVSHRVHEVLFGALFGSAWVGAVTQLRRVPSRAGALQSVICMTSFFLVLLALGRLDPLAFLFVGLAVLVLILHPERGPWFRPQASSIVLAGVGFWPLFWFGWEHYQKALVEAADHVTHWGGVAAWSIALAALGLVAGLRPSGHRLNEATVGVNGALLVVASLAFPFDASARPGVFGLVLAIWSGIWLFKLVRPASSSPGRLGRVARFAGFGLLALFSVVGTADDPPNVPHGLEGVEFSAVDQTTCLDCHAFGREGATPVPHEHGRTCDGDCWGGRADCLGCHRYDPDLGGPTEMAFGSSPTAWFSRGTPLRANQVQVLRSG